MIPFSGHRPCILSTFRVSHLLHIQLTRLSTKTDCCKDFVLRARARAEKVLRTLSERRATRVKPFERDLFHVPYPLKQTMFMRGVSDYGGRGVVNFCYVDDC